MFRKFNPIISMQRTIGRTVEQSVYKQYGARLSNLAPCCTLMLGRDAHGSIWLA